MKVKKIDSSQKKIVHNFEYPKEVKQDSPICLFETLLELLFVLCSLFEPN